MKIQEDSRQQVGRHELKHAQWTADGTEIFRSKVIVGDYCKLPEVSVDTKAGLPEIAQNIGGAEHKRFINELKLAQQIGCKLYVLIETTEATCIEDVRSWRNPRLDYYAGSITGERLAKAMHTIESRYGCTFLFCKPEEAARRITELLT